MAKVFRADLPENEGEAKVIGYLRDHLPEHYVIFHNMEISRKPRLPYEYDVIVVGDYAIYCVEVKDYTGFIVVRNGSTWQGRNKSTLQNPLKINHKKAKILASDLKRKASGTDVQKTIGDLFVDSLVVFPDEQIKIEGGEHFDEIERVLRLPDLPTYLTTKPPAQRNMPASERFLKEHRDTVVKLLSEGLAPSENLRTIGDFQILETISQNDRYDAFLCQHQIITNRRYLLKVYSLDVYQDDSTRKKQEELIRRDAIALHQIQVHLNVVDPELPFYWRDGDKFVLPLDWVEGLSLADLYARGKKFDYSEALDIAKQICQGLHHAQQHGVIHRNLTPDSIILPDDSPLKIVNFDLARVQDMKTIASEIKESIDDRYAAPEVARNGPSAVTKQSDIYSLGVILFELLTGKHPYKSRQAVDEAEGLPRKPTQVKPELPKHFDELLMGMCAYKQADRYKDLAETLEYLEIASE